jgi:predicted Zn-dependent protease
MARPGDAVLCPSCGTRNKPKWELCVRCGESLAGALPAPDSVGGKTTAMVSDAGLAEPSPWNAVLAVLALGAFVGVGAAATKYVYRAGPAAVPDPTALTIPTQPPKPLPPVPAVNAPGGDVYAEGRRLLTAGDPAGAARLLRQAVAAAPNNALYLRTYGEALFMSGEQDAGLYALSQAARLQPSPYRLEYVRFLDVAGRSADAAAQVDMIVAENPGDVDTLVWAGRIYSSSGDFARAQALLKQASQARPMDAELLSSLGTASEAASDWNQAALAYGTIVLLQPENHLVRGRLAEMFLKVGKPDQAIQTYRRGLDRDPNAAVLYRGLGSVLEDAGKPAEAAAAYREYARLSPQAPDAPGLIVRADRLAPPGGS